MENKEDLGHIITPSGKVNIAKYLIFDEAEKRQYKIILTEDDNILIVLDSNIHGDENVNKQQMYLTKESFALMFLAMTKSRGHFGIDVEEILKCIIPSGGLGYSSYPAETKEEQL